MEISNFKNLIKIDEITNCWNWTYVKDRTGYGHFYINGNGHVLAHRLSAYLYLNFNLNSELLVLHKCNNRSCVNPEHLKIGDYQDNARDAVSSGTHSKTMVTHCPLGHEYNERNTYIRPNGHRNCRICHNLRMKRINRNKRVSISA